MDLIKYLSSNKRKGMQKGKWSNFNQNTKIHRPLTSLLLIPLYLYCVIEIKEFRFSIENIYSVVLYTFWSVFYSLKNVQYNLCVFFIPTRQNEKYLQ